MIFTLYMNTHSNRTYTFRQNQTLFVECSGQISHQWWCDALSHELSQR